MRLFIIGLAISLRLVILGALVAVITVAWIFFASLPSLVGEEEVAGLTDGVTIVRDHFGVPTIEAANDSDAVRALGYLHAQDRMWQMEMTRRIAAGRLAALIGQRGVRIDRVMRVFNLYALAQKTVETLPDDFRDWLETYVAGVNALIAERGWAAAPEYGFLMAEPEPWTLADSLVWGRLMALQLGSDWRSELLRQQLLTVLPRDRIEALWPTESRTVSDSGRGRSRSRSHSRVAGKPAAKAEPAPLLEAARLGRMQNNLPAVLEHRQASNVWVVDGSHTATKAPILANDPHLGLESPNHWYLVRLQTPGRTLAGATVPGVPMVVIGHNGRIAWGMTSSHADTQDLFIETVASDRPDHYLSPGGPRKFETREEVIKVRWGEPIHLTVRATRHGPVISDVLEPHVASRQPSRVLALSSTALMPIDRTAEALYRMNLGREIKAFKAALRLFQAPQQNIVWASRSGQIGFKAAGRVPVRRSGDGFFPQDGASGAGDWIGFLSASKLPYARKLTNGRFVNANNDNRPPRYPYFLGRNFSADYRARRIDELLDRSAATIKAHLAIQYDRVSVMARDLLALLLPLAASEDNPPRVQEALALLSAWDASMDRHRPEPLLFNAWQLQLVQSLFGDEVAPSGAVLRGLRPRAVVQALTRDHSWCDNRQTAGVKESCASIVRSSLRQAVNELVIRHGDDLSSWRWGAVHKVRLRHRLFRHLPLLSWWSTVEIETDGGDFTINRGTFSEEKETRFEHRHGAGLRMVADLSDLERSMFIQAVGQSGHPASLHYSGMLAMWRDGEAVPLDGHRALDNDVMRLIPKVILPD